MNILNTKSKSKIIELAKPITIKTYLAVSVLGKSLNLNINYKKIEFPELNLSKTSVVINLPMRYKNKNSVEIVSEAIEKMYNEIATEEIANSMEKARMILGFAPEDYNIKRMKNCFCKVNKDKTIIINPDIMKYSQRIIDTTIIQSFCKMMYKENSKQYLKNLKFAINEYENIIEKRGNQKFKENVG